MDDNKVFEPEVVSEALYPNEVASSIPSGEGTPSVGTVTPQVTKENRVPFKRSSYELLSTALNTRSRNILQEFELQQSGGIKIGDFQEGTTGDVRITPNGITARDNAGITTFSLDGLTGNAVFAGEIRSGSLVSGNVAVLGGNFIVYDGDIPIVILGVF